MRELHHSDGKLRSVYAGVGAQQDGVAATCCSPHALDTVSNWDVNALDAGRCVAPLTLSDGVANSVTRSAAAA